MRRDVLTLLRGSDWATTWPLTDADGASWVWQATDEVRAQLRAGHAGGTVLHTWTDATSGVDTSVNGQLTLKLGYTVSEGWTETRAVCDVEITRSGVRSRPISFVLQIEPDITTV
jgi:hypothetical protein